MHCGDIRKSYREESQGILCLLPNWPVFIRAGLWDQFLT